ncbi:hypothetical protein JRO89_XS01G0063200 [Xanthoceras sorbifolium]|uniref:Uncharacterized protein n=1 Tax=Xanthoceras sorbifolium TaxID=99658 RepID=A0ABQ8IJ65_9ROSI|nr:hypothetical protein JRO89_XS01G0063200 [Xanthoceras sorbifolium]
MVTSLNLSDHLKWFKLSSLERKDGGLYLCEGFSFIIFATAKTENKSEVGWTLLHRQVCGFIKQWVSDNVLNHISGKTHARALWNKVEQLYARKTGNNKLFLNKQMVDLKYKYGAPMIDYMNTYQGILNQLAGVVIRFEDEVQALWILSTLPDSWETFNSLLQNFAPNGVITILAKENLLNEEMRRKNTGIFFTVRSHDY